jgi:large subunit ribosomal protein L15
VLRTPVHIIVSQASREAIAAVEAAGGTITTRYYTKPAIDNVLAGRSHPIHSRLFRPTPITELASSPHAEYQYELPDPAKRKVLEYYRDAAHRGYLSYQVPLGHSPSLYFKTPGTVLRSSKKEKEERLVENRLW